MLAAMRDSWALRIAGGLSAALIGVLLRSVSVKKAVVE